MQLPYALRDPFRDSHFTSPDYLRAVAGCARTISPRCRQGAKTGLLDLSLIQTDKYEEALRQGDQQAVGRRGSARRSSTTSRPQWDAITEQVGVDKQKAVYAAWAAKSGAYPK